MTENIKMLKRTLIDLLHFRLQPNLETRKKQIDAWCSLVLTYHRHHRIYTLDVVEAQDGPLFHNKDISRKLPLDTIYVVLEELRKKGKFLFRFIYS